MITNVSRPNSTLKKSSNGNSYHQVRDVAATGIVSIAHCDTEYNLSDMGNKALPGATHQCLLQNQCFAPELSARECQTDMSNATSRNRKQTGLLQINYLRPSHDSIAYLNLLSHESNKDLLKAISDESFIQFLRFTLHSTSSHRERRFKREILLVF